MSHEGHQGIVKTKRLLRSAVWFPGMDRMTEDVVRSCLPCQAATQQKPKEPLRMTELPERPWQKISLDFSGPYPSGEYCLIVVDDYSRYPVVELVSTTSAAGVIPRLDNFFFCLEYQKNASQTMVHPSKAESLKSMQKRKDLDIGRLHRYIQRQTVRQKDLRRPCRSSSPP